ncbi:MAG: molybdopterin-dependent oxidoreductase [Verrucomicrobiae bacterium]|nr:molybdopterin-dependent oxidoreductase [Verrucomicrobiae bacterium]
MPSDKALPINRRSFVRQTAIAAGAVAMVKSVGAEALARTHPFLTPADDFNDVSRGRPKPHTLQGQALVDARLTPDTWRLEITADGFVEPPSVKRPASLERSLTLDQGSALDLPSLIELGRTRSVKYIKAMQCLNIPTPLGQGLWEGVPLRDVLRLCGRMDNVRRIYYRGFHNNDPRQVFQSSVSYTQAMETPPGELPVFLAYRLNGEALTLERGGPVRMIVPWAHGFKSIKWLRNIYVTNDHRTNDTYADNNNDPESRLKTAAYVDDGPKRIRVGETALLSGRVISGLSGVRRVEYWVRKVGKDSEMLEYDAPELLLGPWVPCDLEAQPDWSEVLPEGVNPRRLLGFDSKSGLSLSWPPRYGMASYSARIKGLKAGRYEVRARAVDLNGHAQPEPRPYQKSGKNALQVWRFEVV